MDRAELPTLVESEMEILHAPMNKYPFQKKGKRTPKKSLSKRRRFDQERGSVKSDIGHDKVLRCHEKGLRPRSLSEREIEVLNQRSVSNDSVYYKSNKHDLIPSFPHRSVKEKLTWSDDFSEDEPRRKSLNFRFSTLWKPRSKEIPLSNTYESDGEASNARGSRMTLLSQSRSSDVSTIYNLERTPAQDLQNHPALQSSGQSLLNAHNHTGKSFGKGASSSKGFLSDFVYTQRIANSKPTRILSNIWKKNTSDAKESEESIMFARQANRSNNLQDLYWEQALQNITDRRRKGHSRKRKWGEQSIERIIKKMEAVGNVMDTKSYYTVFRYNNGRTWPKQELLLSIIWTTIFLCLHRNYLDWGPKILFTSFDPWFSYSLINYFAIALGFLLYMQADASSRRWIEGRVQWQLIVENSKRLAVLLNTNLTCLRLARYSTRLVLGHTICTRNQVQQRKDKAWKENMLQVLDWKFVNEVMRYPKRLRYLVVLYGLQRLVQYCIEKNILPVGVVRDINPTIITMSQSLGACNRIRVTKLPYNIAVHLQFILIVFIGILPMSLVGLQREVKSEHVSQMTFPARFNIFEIYVYEIIIAYAYFGLSRMAIDICDPFSFTRENHSFGFWGFYELWTTVDLEVLRKIFRFRCGKGGKNVRSQGIYGEEWVSEKLETPIERTINKDLSKEHNLHGRTDEIRRQLQVNKRNTSYWNGFGVGTFRDSFTFASASEDEDFKVPISHVRRSICYDRTSITNQKISLSMLLPKFTLRIPGTPSRDC